MCKCSKGATCPVFVKTLEGEYIRVELIDKLWVADEGEIFCVTATMLKTENGDLYHDLFSSENFETAMAWLDSLAKKLNGVAD